VSGLNGLHWIEHAQGFTSSIWSYMLVFIALVACNSFFDCAIAFYYISDSLNMGCWDGNQTRVTPGMMLKICPEGWRRFQSMLVSLILY
jgi:hypothetical protein